MRKVTSGILYNGPSVIDGKPIVVIAIGSSSNIKTGNMVQTYIIRSDMDPSTANRKGEDRSVCGECKHMGKAHDKPTGNATGRTCYVNLGQGPRAVYAAFKRGRYPMLAPQQAASIGAGRMVRLGTYGDPSAVPSSVFDALLQDAAGHTGYTHQGISTDKRFMVSADSLADAKTAWYSGRRTFRVIPVREWQDSGKGALDAHEVLCPASHEAGRRVTCAKCKLCDGSKAAKSIAIVAHGATRGKVT